MANTGKENGGLAVKRHRTGGPVFELTRVAVQAFLQSPSLDAQSLHSVQPAQITSGLVHSDGWGHVLSSKLAPTGPLLPKAVKSVISLTLRLCLGHLAAPVESQREFCATFQGSEFLRSVLPLFVLSEHCGIGNAVTVCRFCALLRGNVPSDLRPVIRALMDLEFNTAAARSLPLSVALLSVLTPDTAAPALPVASVEETHTPVPVLPQFQPEAFQAALHKILPSCQDFQLPAAFHPKSLPILKTDSAYQSVHQYLDALFGLLRADYFSDFVHAVHFTHFALPTALSQLSEQAQESIRNAARFYGNVHVIGTTPLPQTQRGSCLVLSFWHPEHPSTNWKDLPYLRRGSLLCITTDRFRSEVVWATVVDSHIGFLEAGVICVELLSGSEADLHRLLRRNFINGAAADSIIGECPIVFAPYAATLATLLRERHAAAPRIPFKELFVSAVPRTPGSSALQKFCGPLYASPSKQEVDGLDPSQRCAFDAFVRGDCLVVVQGPAGTGKSFTLQRMARLAMHGQAEAAIQRRLARESRKAPAALSGVEELRQTLVTKRLQSGAERVAMGPLLVLSDCARTLHRHLCSCASALPPDLIQPEDLLLVGLRPEEAGQRLYSTLDESFKLFGQELSLAREPVQRSIDAILTIVENYSNGRLSLELVTRHLSPDHCASLGNPLTYELLVKWLGCDTSPDGETEFAEEYLKKLREVAATSEGNWLNGCGSVQPSGTPTPPLANAQAHHACLIDQPNTPQSVVRGLIPAPLVPGNIIAVPPTITPNTNLGGLPSEDRWSVAKQLLTMHQAELQYRLNAEWRRYTAALRDYQTKREELLYRLFSGVAVIALRPQAVLAYRDILRVLSPSVVLVDDAQCLIEPVFVASLASLNVAQLVIAGESRSWRSSVHVVAHREGKLNCLDAPFLERINHCGFPVYYCDRQYRLDPLSAHIAYHWCGNAQLVPRATAGAKARGLPHSCHFLHHEEAEEYVDGQVLNRKQAAIVLQLLRYLLESGVEASRITVFATTPGQVSLLSADCQALNVCCLLPAQFVGQEADIAIVSLVYTSKIGQCLVSPEYSVNMITRSRNGWYCIGNALALDTTRLLHWQFILYQLSHLPGGTRGKCSAIVTGEPPW
eukprot:TRINITY_DN11955_c0_g1_i1.p1 TRINITY_DN11955_c0_g1~~TRINITY_DN11955_c0_g1_i1.p1  ORF type:complete len:1122 (+),score=144.30 TRINITY_DN11955_c0_g1_i1:33-3398(+)